MNIAALGGGVNSAAMITGMYRDGIPIDLILFADTGAERPETYAFVRTFSQWCVAHDLPPVTTVRCTRANGDIYTIEDDCLRRKTLPAVAFGWKTCSSRFKTEPQDKYCNNHLGCKATWGRGEKVHKWIGYDAGEEKRVEHEKALNRLDKKYERHYWLYDNGINRDECAKIIKAEGLPVPGKSACWCCPNTKKKEIRQLAHEHPELLERALRIEDTAQPYISEIKGLGRDWRWRDFIEHDGAQGAMCEVFEDSSMPCGCYDG